ncbi:hypothetical protein CPT34_24745 [Rhizobium sophoriradicis]|uniref:Uncharacterized protein n=1 Tax=Rhizobium sophoriradicis TaxID=1535245 RepID=A0A2A5KN94_9HYPH|nr:hypothetical protein CPT34_24745 [Rhizobium sophoriradicis]
MPIRLSISAKTEQNINVSRRRGKSAESFIYSMRLLSQILFVAEDDEVISAPADCPCFWLASIEKDVILPES